MVRRCGICKEIGHNRRTCKLRNDTEVEHSDSNQQHEVDMVQQHEQTAFEQQEEPENNGAGTTISINTGSKPPTIRRCGLCRQTGHNRRTCTLGKVPEDNDSTLVSADETFLSCGSDSFRTCDSELFSCRTSPTGDSSATFCIQSHKLSVATLNLNTLMKCGQRHLLHKDLKRLDIDILCLQETRISESSAQGLGNEYYMFTSAADARGCSGVGIIIRTGMQVFLVEYISERIMILGLKHMSRTFLVCSAYAPTNVASTETVREAFWQSLEATITRATTQYPEAEVILGGDFNAEIGTDMLGQSRFIGLHLDSHRTTENGQELLELCNSLNIYLQNSRNRSPKQRRYSFRGFAGNRKATLDYVGLSSTLHRKWIRTRVRSTLVDTDHRCVIVDLDLARIKRKQRSAWKPRLFSALKSDLKYKLNEAIRGKRGQMEGGQFEDFGTLQAVVQEAMKTCIQSPFVPRTEWITDGTMLLCHVRREASTYGLQGEPLVVLNRMCRAEIKKDKKKWLEERTINIRRAAAFGNMKEVYDNINRLSGKHRATVGYMGDPKELTSYFRGMGGEPIPVERNILKCESEREEHITLREIKTQLSNFRRGRIAGPDGIPAEIWGSLDDDNLLEVARLMSSWIRDEAEIPHSIRKADIISLHKKGDFHSPQNFRGISLLQVAFKLYERVIAARLDAQLELLYSENQSGFRKQRSTMDNIFTIQRLCEAAYDHDVPMTIVLLDFREAFDSLNLPTCWNLLTQAGLSKALVAALSRLYQVIDYGTFQRTRGVPQGSVLGPKIFTAALQLALGPSEYPDIWELFYADDSAAMALGKTDHVQSYLNSFAERTSRIDLRLNPNKITVLTTDPNHSPLTLLGTTLNVSTHAKYLGVELECTGCHKREVERRISLARIAFLRLMSFFKRRDISIKLKMQVYETTVRSVLLYGAGSWRLTKAEFKRLDGVDRNFRRKIVRGWRFTATGQIRCISNRRLKRMCNIPELSVAIRQLRLRWLGHVVRMDDSRPPKKALNHIVALSRHKRRPGGVRKSYLRQIKEDLNIRTWNTQQTVKVIYKKASDREAWKSLIK